MVERKQGLDAVNYVPENLFVARFDFIISRHAEPGVGKRALYGETNAELSENGTLQARRQGLRLFRLYHRKQFTNIFPGKIIPHVDLEASDELKQKVREGLKNATDSKALRRIAEVVPTESDKGTVERVTKSRWQDGYLIDTVFAEYTTDRPRGVLTARIATDTFQQQMHLRLKRKQRSKIRIVPPLIDARLSSANTFDVLAYIGITDKFDMLRAWHYLDSDPQLQELFHFLGGKTPEDVRNDLVEFIGEKVEAFLPLNNLGIRIIMKITTHETHKIPILGIKEEIGYASETLIRLDEFNKDDWDFQFAGTPFLNKPQRET